VGEVEKNMCSLSRKGSLGQTQPQADKNMRSNMLLVVL